jgi:hypothetical protein
VSLRSSAGYEPAVTRRRHTTPSNALAPFVVDALATYRLTRLLVSDGIVDRPRQALLRRCAERGHTKLVELIECPWCTGFWMSVVAVGARRVTGRRWAPVGEVLALSAVAGLLAAAVRALDDHHDAAASDDAGDDDVAPPAPSRARSRTRTVDIHRVGGSPMTTPRDPEPPVPGDSDAPLPAAATGEQVDPDETELDREVTEHAATPRSWQREADTPRAG